MHVIRSQFINITDAVEYPLRVTCTCQLLDMHFDFADRVLELIWRTDPSAEVDLHSRLHLVNEDEEFADDLIYIGYLNGVMRHLLIEVPAFEAPLIKEKKRAAIIPFSK